MEYKLINKWLGIEVYNLHSYEGFFFVNAKELEAKLAEGFEVYGCISGNEVSFDNKLVDGDETIALAIGKQPIKKKTREEAALEYLQDLVQYGKNKNLTDDCEFKRAKEILEME